VIIYKITNLINGKIYVGQTRNGIKERWRGHCKFSKSNMAITRAIIKYGKENFKIEQIDCAKDLYELDNKEVYYIKKLNTLSPNGYNLNSGGNANKVVSEESLEKMSRSQLKRYENSFSPRLGCIGILNPRSKPVICTTTGKMFESARQAALELKVLRSHVNEIARGKPGRKSTKGYRFRYLGMNLEII